MSTILGILHASHWLAALLLLGLAIYCFRLKKHAAVRALALFCALASLWALLAALIVIAPDLPTKIALNRIKLLAPTLLPLCLLALGFALYGERRWHRWALALFAVIPLTTTFVLANNSLHETHIGSYRILTVGGHELLAFADGPWFRVHNLNARVAAFLTMALLWFARRDLSATHSYRVWIIIVAILVPLVGDTVAVHFVKEIRYAQATPTLLLVTALLLIYAVRRRHFIDVVPFARRHILDGTDDLYLIADGDACLVDFNAGAGAALRLDRTDLGQPLTTLAVLRPEVAALLTACDTAPHEWSMGADVYEVRRHKLADPRSGRAGSIVACKCITLRKQAERSLEELNQIKTKILAVIGHDFQGNLAASLVIAQSLRQSRAAMTEQDLTLAAGHLEALARQNIAVIDSLLHWSKLRLGSDPGREPVDLDDLAAKVCAFFEPIAASRGIALETRPSGGAQAYGNEAAVTTILRNFLSNALKAAPARSRISVEVEARATDDTVDLIVEDAGPGIAPERLPTLFQLKHGKQSGIGLYLCREFAESIGATIAVDTQPGQGSRFTLSLPAGARGLQSTDPAPTPARCSSPATPPQRSAVLPAHTPAPQAP